MATALGLPGADATLADLRAVPAQKIVDNAAGPPGRARRASTAGSGPARTRDGFASGATFDVPLIVGSNNGEGGADRANEIVDLAASGAPSFQYYFTYVPEPRTGGAAEGRAALGRAALRVREPSHGRRDYREGPRGRRRMNSCWAAFAKAPSHGAVADLRGRLRLAGAHRGQRRHRGIRRRAVAGPRILEVLPAVTTPRQ